MQHADRIRVISGAVTGAAGLAVALAMTVRGGSMARFLPDGPGFHLAALSGAVLAGIALADGFGRRGRRGAALAMVAAPAVTGVGACIGAALLTLVYAVVLPLSGMGALQTGALTGAPVLGLIAVTDGIGTSAPVAMTWVMAMACVHVVLRRARGA